MYNVRENPATVKTQMTQPVWTFLYHNVKKGHNFDYIQIPPQAGYLSPYDLMFFPPDINHRHLIYSHVGKF